MAHIHSIVCTQSPSDNVLNENIYLKYMLVVLSVRARARKRKHAGRARWENRSHSDISMDSHVDMLNREALTWTPTRQKAPRITRNICQNCKWLLRSAHSPISISIERKAGALRRFSFFCIRFDAVGGQQVSIRQSHDVIFRRRRHNCCCEKAKK